MLRILRDVVSDDPFSAFTARLVVLCVVAATCLMVLAVVAVV